MPLRIDWWLAPTAVAQPEIVGGGVEHAGELTSMLTGDALRIEALAAVAALDLRDCWIGAGFVRDAVWDHLHGYERSAPRGDVDVVWHGTPDTGAELDREIERRLGAAIPVLQWSVKNQARMHLRNGDLRYGSVAEAMRHWPETATAIAVAIDGSGRIRVNAPFGLDDLYAPRLTPTPAFRTRKRPIYDERVSSKDWVRRYPMLEVNEVGHIIAKS